MTPGELLSILKSLPAETPMTVEEVVNLLSSLQPSKTEPDHQEAYSTWDNDKLIDTKTLAARIGERPELLSRWRVEGKGPKYISKPRYVSYRVGDVRKWLISRTVQPTTEADHKLAATQISKHSPGKWKPDTNLINRLHTLSMLTVPVMSEA